MIFDPTMPVGTAIVLGDHAVLIGRQGDGPLEIDTGNAAQALGLPLVSGTPLAEAEGAEVSEGVLLVNPSSSTGTINYNIDGTHYVAEPGMSQKLPPLPDGRNWLIEYDRGAQFGQAAYTLTPGTYYFTPTELGWQLYRQHFELVLDNSQSNQQFNFIFRGDDLIVPAGGARTLRSNYPIVLRFDRGNGTDFVAKTTYLTTGNLEIGVSANDNLWDVFPTTDNRREVTGLKPFKTDEMRTRAVSPP